MRNEDFLYCLEILYCLPRVMSETQSYCETITQEVGYPPDMALLITETVLEQAEQLADELSAA
uniref:Uncharacterized protein n=1 Tax=Acinetobacter seifertii TaxID=1530123 RepID=A0A5P1I661_9GAMM|nr:hypothetical protein ASP1069_00035 [Acinetobacter seifertii]